MFKRETIAIKVDKTCIFEGIGILPGAGRTEATLAEKDVLALSILLEEGYTYHLELTQMNDKNELFRARL